MFQHILAPIDGSESSKNALTTAFELAKIHGSRVKVLHVMTFTETVPSEKAEKEGSPSDYIEDYITRVRKNDERMLAAALEQAKAMGLGGRVTTKLMIGRPGDAILSESSNGDHDLIVIGDRGLTGVKELLLGSVSKQVVDESKIPVLVVKLFFTYQST
jgi:nucleotide-binding universal stress UspA family protein